MVRRDVSSSEGPVNIGDAARRGRWRSEQPLDSLLLLTPVAQWIEH